MVAGRVFGKTPRRRVVMTMSFDEAELMTHALEDRANDLLSKVMRIEDGSLTVPNPEEWASNLRELAEAYYDISNKVDQFLYFDGLQGDINEDPV